MELLTDMRRTRALALAMLLILVMATSLCLVSPLMAMAMPSEWRAVAADACVFDSHGAMSVCPHPGQEEIQGAQPASGSETPAVWTASDDLRLDSPSAVRLGRDPVTYVSAASIHSPPLRL